MNAVCGVAGSQDPAFCAFDPHAIVGRIRYWKPRSREVCWKVPWAKNRAEAWQDLVWQLPVQTTSEQESAEMLQSNLLALTGQVTIFNSR